MGRHGSWQGGPRGSAPRSTPRPFISRLAGVSSGTRRAGASPRTPARCLAGVSQGTRRTIVASGSFYPVVFVGRRPRDRRVRITKERRKDFRTLLYSSVWKFLLDSIGQPLVSSVTRPNHREAPQRLPSATIERPRVRLRGGRLVFRGNRRALERLRTLQPPGLAVAHIAGGDLLDPEYLRFLRTVLGVDRNCDDRLRPATRTVTPSLDDGTDHSSGGTSEAAGGFRGLRCGRVHSTVDSSANPSPGPLARSRLELRDRVAPEFVQRDESDVEPVLEREHRRDVRRRPGEDAHG